MTDQNSEGFGNFPKFSATFGTLPHDAEEFGMVRNSAERTEHHTLTVRETARMFEQASVARTERSIINWCQPNRQGVCRLDAFFDTNERKYFITPQSVTLAIREEQSKQPADAANTANSVELSKNSERAARQTGDTDELPNLRLEVRDLEITNRAKDYFIKRLEEQLVKFDDERQRYVEQLIASSRQIGELQTTVVQLGGGANGALERLPKFSESGRIAVETSPENDAGSSFQPISSEKTG